MRHPHRVPELASRRLHLPAPARERVTRIAAERHPAAVSIGHLRGGTGVPAGPIPDGGLARPPETTCTTQVSHLRPTTEALTDLATSRKRPGLPLCKGDHTRVPN